MGARRRREASEGTRVWWDSCFGLPIGNPCPCGYYGDLKRECRCTSGQVQKYRQKISGPLLDRIDLHVEVPLVEYRELASGSGGEDSEAIRARVERARAIQRARFAAPIAGAVAHGNDAGKAGGRQASASRGRHSTTPPPGTNSNSRMSSREVRAHCAIDAESSALLEHAMDELDFSARAHDRILKVARTLADLEAAEAIAASHVLEAIQYRTLDRKLWA